MKKRILSLILIAGTLLSVSCGGSEKDAGANSEVFTPLFRLSVPEGKEDMVKMKKKSVTLYLNWKYFIKSLSYVYFIPSLRKFPFASVHTFSLNTVDTLALRSLQSSVDTKQHIINHRIAHPILILAKWQSILPEVPGDKHTSHQDQMQVHCFLIYLDREVT